MRLQIKHAQLKAVLDTRSRWRPAPRLRVGVPPVLRGVSWVLWSLVCSGIVR